MDIEALDFAPKTDHSDDKLNDTRAYVGLMTKEEWAKKKQQIQTGNITDPSERRKAALEAELKEWENARNERVARAEAKKQKWLEDEKKKEETDKKKKPIDAAAASSSKKAKKATPPAAAASRLSFKDEEEEE